MRPEALSRGGKRPEMLVSAPRLLIGSPASGAGKTMLACGLMRALMNRGLKVQACKCGPDYIDPLFHREVVGTPSRNVDLFFMGEGQMRDAVAQGARDCDVTVIEGAMGYYDGIAVSDEASAWDVARVSKTPVLLVVDASGRARSVAAEIMGFSRFRNPSQLAGVVLNRVPRALYPRLKRLVEDETGLRVFGFLPALAQCSLESRHLGLVAAGEVEDLKGKVETLACTLEETLDIDGVLDVAARACPLACAGAGDLAPVGGDPVIAVAHDEAFCFYYEDTLRLFERLGARLRMFSPLADAQLPAGTQGLYLGGGYPELHAARLSRNEGLKASLRQAIGRGMPAIAECGGFMYLHESLEDDKGCAWPMVGSVAGTSYRTGSLGRFGYIEMTARHDDVLCAAGERLRAHEFHYWESDNPGSSYHAQKPQSGRAWDCVHSNATLYAGYPHLCLHAHPRAAERFVRACAGYTSSPAEGEA